MYTGLTTGMCGCLTTFATWNQAASIKLVRGSVVDALLLLALQVRPLPRCPPTRSSPRLPSLLPSATHSAGVKRL